MARASKNKPAKQQQKGLFGLLKKVGVEATPAETPADIERLADEKKIKEAWIYLRSQIDRAVHQFYAENGSFTALEEVVDRPALDAIKEHLIRLRENRTYWQQPNRAAETILPGHNDQIIEVIDRKPPDPPKLTEFTIQERFIDKSAEYEIAGDQLEFRRRNPGQQRILQCKVAVSQGRYFRLKTVHVIDGEFEE